MNPLTRYYIHQARGGGDGSDIRPIYSVPPYVQRGHGIGEIFGSSFRSLKSLFFSDIKTTTKEEVKALGREALRKGSRILFDIADNPRQVTAK